MYVYLIVFYVVSIVNSIVKSIGNVTVKLWLCSVLLVVLAGCASAPDKSDDEAPSAKASGNQSTSSVQSKAKANADKATKATEEKLRLTKTGLGVSFDYPVFLLGAFDFDINGAAARAQSRRFYLLNRRQSIDDIDRIFSQSAQPGALILERRPEGDNLHVLFYDIALVPRRVLKVALSRRVTDRPGFSLMRGVEVFWDQRYSEFARIRITHLPMAPNSIQPGTPRSKVYSYRVGRGAYLPER